MLLIKKTLLKYYNWFLFKNRRFSIIVSTGRTGTKFMEELINSSSKCKSYHELSSDDTEYSINLFKGTLAKSDFLNYYFSTRRFIFKNRDAKIIVESNGGLVFSASELLRYNKKLRIVLIVRDPRNFVKSGCNRTFIDENGKIRKTYEIEKNWDIKAYKVDKSISKSDWIMMSMPERFMWIWSFKNSLIYNLSKTNDRVMVFRFEDVFKQPKLMNKMLEFLCFNQLELDIPNIKKNLIIKKNKNPIENFPEYNKWDDHLKDALNKYCGELMNEFNYE